MSRLIAAAAPYYPTAGDKNVEYVWSGNTAAAVGVAVCLLVLLKLALERDWNLGDEEREEHDGNQDR